MFLMALWMHIIHKVPLMSNTQVAQLCKPWKKTSVHVKCLFTIVNGGLLMFNPPQYNLQLATLSA